MRWRGLVLCAALVVSACGGASAATDSSSKGPPSRPSRGVPCGPAVARTLAASGVARVYVSGRKVFGCSRQHRRAIVLGNAQSCLGGTEAGPVAVAGEVAAYGATRCGVDTGRALLIVRRLDTGKTLHSEAAITGRVGVEGHSSVDSVVVKPDGSAAWIGESHAIGPPHSGTEVHKVTAAGAQLLDSGLAIATDSLRLHRSLVSWRHGTRTRTARLL